MNYCDNMKKLSNYVYVQVKISVSITQVEYIKADK